MRVNIGPYRSWIGPYQISDKLPFLSEDIKHSIGEWLADTWVNDVCQWIDRHKKRKEYVRIDGYDTWNADHTLALIILPLLKKLQEQKCGSPYVDDEDVPPHMRYEGENWHHYKWEWVLNEMIWAFEHIVDDSWENKFYHDSPKFEVVENENGELGVNQVNEDFWVDRAALKEHNDRIGNGLRLFGKYYRSLWS